MFRGRVVPGDARGRILGFPTANLDLSVGDLPAEGIYACLTLIPGEMTFRGGTLSVGTNPTFGDVSERRVELYIHDYSGNLYDLLLGVVVVDKLRDTVSLSTREALIEQAEADVAASRAVIDAVQHDVGSVLFTGTASWVGF